MPRSHLPKVLNICMVADSFPILGRAATHGFLWPIAKGLSESGHNVTVLSLKSRLAQREITRDGVTAFFLHEGSNEFMKIHPQEAVFQKFVELHSQKKFHIVHSIDSTGVLIGQNKKNLDIMMTYNVEATKMNELFAVLGRSEEDLAGAIGTGINVLYQFLKSFVRYDYRLLSTADGVFVTSPQQRIVLERYYLYPDAKTYTVPYGLEIGDFNPEAQSVDRLRSRLKLTAENHVALTITDMKDASEIRSLLAAFQRVVLKKPRSRLVIVGSGPLEKEIEYEVLMLALGKKVILTGDVTATELTDYIAISDVLVNLSSRASGFEPSLLEAMAQKKVIIGSEVSPIETIVEDGIDGFLIRPADHITLAELLIKIFSRVIDARTIGQSAANKVMGIFDTNKMVQQTVNAYLRILIDSRKFEKRSNLLEKLAKFTHSARGLSK